MVSGIARRMQQADPRKVRVQYERPRWSLVWDHNPRIATLKEDGDFQVLHGRVNGLRPYHSAKSADKWTYNLAYRPEPGELYFTADERAYGEEQRGRILIEPHIKPGASPNKQWGWERWQRLTELLIAADLKPTQIGTPDQARMPGIRCLWPATFRMACAAIATARACVLPEGGLHHAAAAVGTPAVVIFGGFTPVELTGYPGHVNLGVSLNDACGNRRPCAHCAAEMAKITPEQVVEQLLAILRR